jgi:hypothetical protein
MNTEHEVSHFAAETAIKLLEVSEMSISSIGLHLSFLWHKGHFISSMGQTLKYILKTSNCSVSAQ